MIPTHGDEWLNALHRILVALTLDEGREVENSNTHSVDILTKSKLEQSVTQFGASETEIDRLVVSELFRRQIEKIPTTIFSIEMRDALRDLERMQINRLKAILSNGDTDLSRVAITGCPTIGTLADLIFSYKKTANRCDQCLPYASRLSIKCALQQNELPSQLMLTGIKRDEYVGQGGCGAVFRGEWGGRTVALKLMNNMWDQKTKRMVIKEVMAQSEVQFDHVLPVLGVGRVGDLGDSDLAIVTPFMDEGTVSQYLEKILPSFDNVAAAAVVLRLSHEFVLGLAHLHNLPSPIVHGDVKPSNLLVERGGRLRISDFGLSRFGRKPDTVTVTGGAGSKRYMAPEMQDGSSAHLNSAKTIETDIYAAGITIWEVYTGQEPFSEQSTTYLILKAIDMGLRPKRPKPCAHNRRIQVMPDRVWLRVNKMWAKKADGRGTMNEARDDFAV